MEIKDDVKPHSGTGMSENDSELNTESVKEQSPGKEKKESTNWLVEWVKFQNARIRLSILISLIILSVLTTVIAGYFCLLVWLPSLWAWGFHPATWKGILSVLGAIYLVIGPFMPFSLSGGTISAIFKMYADDAEKEFNFRINEIEDKQSNYEKILREKDTEGLIPLVTFSRIELEQYYKMGLHQTRRSYQYSIIAMWIGFFIIAFGIISFIIPSSYVNENFTSGNLQILTIGSGVVTEVVSALFLWIYKSSMNRLTYFYNRQVFIHNALLAFKISNSIKESDKAKELIVSKILEFGIDSNKNSILNNQTK
jgi:hypothetical protein